MVGVVGGSGLYDIDGLSELEEVRLTTPFGVPSDAYLVGRLGDVPVAFLPRHGRGHRITPSEINYRANVWGLKQLGVTHVLSVSAVGSLREEVPPGDFVVVDQFIDRTRHRADTFFGDGVVAHVMFADPVCAELRAVLTDSASAEGIPVHDGGTYVCMEGPQFSTRAESHLYRAWGADVIGMTNLQEAKLAREAELHYATVAMSTDYDCWHETHDDVTVDAILATMAKNIGNARRLIARAIPAVASRAYACGCGDALAGAILTHADAIPEEARLRLGLLIGRHIGS